MSFSGYDNFDTNNGIDGVVLDINASPYLEPTLNFLSKRNRTSVAETVAAFAHAGLEQVGAEIERALANWQQTSVINVDFETQDVYVFYIVLSGQIRCYLFTKYESDTLTDALNNTGSGDAQVDFGWFNFDLGGSNAYNNSQDFMDGLRGFSN